MSDRNLLYASVETGYKAGGFFFWSDYNVFQPETITAYTVGSKNRFLDNKLQLNAELFYWKYHNQQISHLGIDSKDIVGFPTENVGEATYKGIEVDLQARPWRTTLVSADVQYEDGVYNSSQQTLPLPSGDLVGGAHVHFQSTTLTALDFLPVEYQHSYSLWNFDLTYHAASDRYWVGTYVDNAFNKTAIDFSFAVPFSGFATGLLQNPRTYGVRVGVHF